MYTITKFYLPLCTPKLHLTNGEPSKSSLQLLLHAAYAGVLPKVGLPTENL